MKKIKNSKKLFLKYVDTKYLLSSNNAVGKREKILRTLQINFTYYK